MFRSIAITLTLCLATITAQAALHSRAGGQAYYDDVLDITWVADANLADTTTFGVLGISTNGAMIWAKANEWIAAMNTGAYLGKSDWRLPTVEPLDGSAFNYSYSYNGSTDDGFNQSEQGTAYAGSTASEMAHLFHNTLDNKGLCDPVLSTAGSCSGPQAGWGLSNAGPFSNVQPYVYWSGTEYAPNTSVAWDFYFVSGEQNVNLKSNAFYAWAVRSGDIAGVPFDDLDSDGVADAVDNCTLVVNLHQWDSDGDGFGNRCDGDLNNNLATNAQDYVLFRPQLGQPSVAPTYNKADINSNGVVNSQDYVLFRSLLGSPPGPSALVP